MPKAAVCNGEGERISEIDLNESLFGVEPNRTLLRSAIISHLARARQGTVGVKTRAEVSGGGRKPWRQKGLGRARQGTIRSPLWRHGGVAFGPRARDYGWYLPKQSRVKALLSALSAKAQDGRIFVIKELKLEKPRTRQIWQILKKLGAEKSALIVTEDKDPNVVLSARNIPGVSVSTVKEMNVYDIMARRYLLITDGALKKLEEVLS